MRRLQETLAVDIGARVSICEHVSRCPPADSVAPPGDPTGTFCTLDICLARLEDIGSVDVRQTVRRMRTQRAFSIQTWDQYYFCYTAVIEYAQRNGKLSPVQWSDSELETDSE